MIEYKVLKEIESNPRHTQRTLAGNLGVSLGKMNYILGGLIEKGIVKAKRLRDQPGSIRWNYLLTPEGIQEKIRITRNYLARRQAEFTALKNEIAELEREVRAEKRV
ncbi:MAG: MarR family EPS-associated transcriptional regulator [Chitinispirillaceae bacterium]|nr:MarR family EPS-associated transcriptional regulator [Chitinispirillaceae bacterium]